MNKISMIFALVLLTVSCKNRELYKGETGTTGQKVDIKINWQSDQVKPTQGMRVNLFSLNSIPAYGIDDLGTDGGTVKVLAGSKVATLCYNYHGNKIYFRNENSLATIEAYTSAISRSTYTKSFPAEDTFVEPDKNFYVGLNTSFDVTPGATDLVINITPRSVIKTYTFEIRGVKGAQYISDTRGAISGMANSIFLSSGVVSLTASTLFFNATAIVVEDKIVGSFQTFGRVESALNVFTIEILFPSSTNGILQKSWDVSPQVGTPNNYTIIIEDAQIEIPYESAGPDSSFSVDIEEWNNVEVVLE